ncbi:hypothetical protein DFP72DRAFT_1066388 [Ephemerocybe angulata]|uniref:Uncharacterized protein n=1 Tax=Ephemerocybe angulata TaxID=980116 RepID=A0A8H6I1G2_9AGAR|nr:hypothetical protein DFP72DRAFT_1066388 [Tulosesus angulatus]
MPGTVRALGFNTRWNWEACDYNERGPLIHLRREAAVKDFTRLYLIERNPKKAFDKWIPGRYTQQNPNVPPENQGRDAAIKYITELQSTPGMTYWNISTFAGNGDQGAFGLFHFRRLVPGTETDFAIMDLLRSTGTCFTDHWDAKNQVFGNETNPLAYF